eukprot:g2855.t1
MCCHVEWAIAGVGLSTAGVLIIFGCPRLWRERESLGKFCGCINEGQGVRAARYVSVLFGIAGCGLIVLAVCQMCWQTFLHGVGAFFFFVPGLLVIFIMTNAAFLDPSHSMHDEKNPLERCLVLGSTESKVLQSIPFALSLIALVLYAPLGNYVAEWILVGAIGMSVALVQTRIIIYSAPLNTP